MDKDQLRIKELEESLSSLTALWDDFLEAGITYNEAYYCFYKGNSQKWEAAKHLLGQRQLKPDQSRL